MKIEIYISIMVVIIMLGLLGINAKKSGYKRGSIEGADIFKNKMKYLLIYSYIDQFCAPVGSYYGGPPYHYMQSYNTFNEANKASKELKNARGIIIYGEPTFQNNLVIYPS